jgi:predicted HicB family RNase H-like nuclease
MEKTRHKPAATVHQAMARRGYRQLQIWIPKELHSAIKVAAARAGRSMAATTIDILSDRVSAETRDAS